MTYYLAEDIKSMFRVNKENIIYGRKGDKVTEISRNVNVSIVEGKSGRFPVNIEKLIPTN